MALRNLELCLPELPAAGARALAREHFRWLGRSLLERGLLWYASPARLRRLIHVEGDVGFAERSEQPVMWLAPHFMGLDVAGVAVLLFQKRKVHLDLPGAERPGARRGDRGAAACASATPRSSRATRPARRWCAPSARATRFFNLPDMDFGTRDAAFVPFFGVPAATLLAPSRLASALDMVVQPVVAEILPGGAGLPRALRAAVDRLPERRRGGRQRRA